MQYHIARHSMIHVETMMWFVFYYVLCTVIVAARQYVDDPEYDFDFYEDLSTDRSNFDKKRIDTDVQDDFYIMNAFDETENRYDVYPNSKDHFATFGNNIDSFKKDPFNKRFSWYKLSEKVYSYTKHRIPGYDYEEFDYMRSRSFQKCDDKSVWTHCLCQFTCSEPDVVDCYTPCRSGCECKEEYVFDEKTQKCLLPEHCWPEDNY